MSHLRTDCRWGTAAPTPLPSSYIYSQQPKLGLTTTNIDQIYLEFLILALWQLVSERDDYELLASIDELSDLLVGVGDSL